MLLEQVFVCVEERARESERERENSKYLMCVCISVVCLCSHGKKVSSNSWSAAGADGCGEFCTCVLSFV